MDLYTLEEKIMSAWNVVDDIKLLCQQMLDGPRPMTEDEIANFLIGLETIYQFKFEDLFSCYEKLVHETHLSTNPKPYPFTLSDEDLKKYREQNPFYEQTR